MEQILREYQEETCTKFVGKKKEKLYGSSVDGRLMVIPADDCTCFFFAYEIDDAKHFRLT